MWDKDIIKLYFFILIPIFLAFYFYADKFIKLNKRYLIYCFTSIIIIHCFSVFSFFFLLFYFYTNTLFLNRSFIKLGLLFNLIIVLLVCNFEAGFGFLELLLNKSFGISSLIKFPVLLIGIGLVGQIIQFFKQRSVKSFDYVGISLLSFIFPILAIVKFEKTLKLLLNSQTEVFQKKHIITSLKLLFFAFVFRLLILIPCLEIVEKGIHAEFHLNFVQSWFAIFSNLILLTGKLLFSSLIGISLINIFSGFLSKSYSDFNADDFIDTNLILLLKDSRLKYTLLSVLFLFVICIIIGLGYFQAVSGSVFLFCALFLIKKKSIIKIFWTFPMLFLFLSLTVSNLYEFKFVVQGAFSFHTLFWLYNELYLIYAIGGEFYLSLLVILIGLGVLYKKNLILLFSCQETKLDYVYILLLPLIILFQL